MTAHEEAVRKFYAAINRGDIVAALELFDDNAVRVEPEGFPSSGTFRGHEELKAQWSEARATWAEGACDVERVTAFGEAFVAFVHVRVRLKDGMRWVEGHIADVFIFRDGKVTEMRTFEKGEEAVRWVAGLDPGG